MLLLAAAVDSSLFVCKNITQPRGVRCCCQYLLTTLLILSFAPVIFTLVCADSVPCLNLYWFLVYTVTTPQSVEQFLNAQFSLRFFCDKDHTCDVFLKKQNMKKRVKFVDCLAFFAFLICFVFFVLWHIGIFCQLNLLRYF